MSRARITLVMYGNQGTGKTSLLDVLRRAGWDIGEERETNEGGCPRVVVSVAKPVRK